MSPFYAYLIALASAVFLAGQTNGALIVNIGDQVLLPDTPNQTITITVSGGDAVQGLNFNLQIDDAGGIKAPAISAVDITGPSTIFSGNNTGQTDVGTGELIPGSQLGLRTTTTSSGSVIADGTLAIVTLDTTGLASGNFTLNLSSTLNGPTDFAGIPVDEFQGGGLSIAATAIPEPNLAMTLSIAAASMMVTRRRRASQRVNS
ncbi:MAG: hypothetical protein AAF745_02220 [Planctomycetota bacterium]